MKNVELVEVQIKRSEWGRGVTGGALWQEIDEAFRLSREGREKAPANQVIGRCCLGFVANVAGVKDECLEGIGEPSDLSQTSMDKFCEAFPGLMGTDEEEGHVLGMQTHHTEQLMSINDEENIDDRAREMLLTEVGREAGVEFVFVD